MKASRFTSEQIVAILPEHAAGASPADLIRRHGISRPTFYQWKKRYGDLLLNEAKRLKALEGHLSAIFDRVRDAQEHEPYGGLRSLILESPSNDCSAGGGPIRMYADLAAEKRPLTAARIVARRVVAVYQPTVASFPNAFLRATVVRVNPKAKTADLRIRIGRSEDEYADIPFSAMFPHELVGDGDA